MWLSGFLSELDEGDRTVLERADLEGWPHAEVVEGLGIGLKAMRSRLHRARHRLRAPLGVLRDPAGRARRNRGSPPARRRVRLLTQSASSCT
ncbi:MAG: hypothetical protein GY711_11055 [bacterium]|nr:hypothetical protein [bacterium]